MPAPHLEEGEEVRRVVEYDSADGPVGAALLAQLPQRRLPPLGSGLVDGGVGRRGGGGAAGREGSCRRRTFAGMNF